MSGYGFYVEGKFEKMIWAANDTAALMQAMSIAMNGCVTQWKLCRIGCEINGEPLVMRVVAKVNDDTVL